MAAAFDPGASVYDAGIVGRVPGYALAQQLTAACLLELVPPEALILVVGAGTGAEVLALGAVAPRWRFTAVDPSGGMLALAREKIAAAGMTERVTFVQGAMQDQELPRHDAAVAVLVSQFVPPGEKALFYRAIAAALLKGAPFLSVDFVPQGAPIDEANRRWKILVGGSAEEATRMMQMISRWSVVGEDALRTECSAAGLMAVGRYFQALNYLGAIFRRH